MKSPFIVLVFLCLLFKVAKAQHYKNCTDPFPVCELKTYHFSTLHGIGEVKDEQRTNNCNQFIEETNSLWLEFEAEQEGTLTFSITPEMEEDDIDFILFRKELNCSALEEVRCMQSGVSYGREAKYSENCIGQTGLDDFSLDKFELSGCKYNDDNFLKFLSVQPEEKYILYVNNYESSGGLSITIEGTTALKKSIPCQEETRSATFEIVDMYPNPTSETLTMRYFSHLADRCTIDLLSIDGSVVQSNNHNNTIGENVILLDVKDLSPSTYLVRISQGGLSSVQQFIKQ